MMFVPVVRMTAVAAMKAAHSGRKNTSPTYIQYRRILWSYFIDAIYTAPSSGDR